MPTDSPSQHCSLATRVWALVFAWLLPVAGAGAALVDHDTFIADTGSGLQWMKLSETFGMEYADVHAHLQVGGQWEGWRYATGSEFEGLMLGQGAIGSSCENGTAFCGFAAGTEGSWSSDIIHLFGDSYYQGYSYPYLQSAGLLADTDAATGHHWTALILADYDTSIGDQRGYIQTHAWHSADNRHGASWLVREATAIPGPHTYVPVPAAAQLYAMALAAFMILRRSIPV